MYEEGAGIIRTFLPCSNGCTPWLHFFHQLFSLLQFTKASHHFVHLGAGRVDLAWWKCFLQSWSGSSFFLRPNPSHNEYSDASGTYGCRAVVDILWYFQLQCPRGRRVYIEILCGKEEMLPHTLFKI